MKQEVWPAVVEEYPLGVEKIWLKHIRLRNPTSVLFSHYTSRSGLEGILSTGGLRATYRMKMNDAGEFSFGRGVIFEALEQIERDAANWVGARQIASGVTQNLENLLDQRKTHSAAYCACLSGKNDDDFQWKTYADGGKGFALVFDLNRVMRPQYFAHMNCQPFLYCAPVIYTLGQQHALVEDLFNAGIDDLFSFSDQGNFDEVVLTQMRNRITREVFLRLYTLINFIKAPIFEREAELRLMLDPNDGTMNASNLEYFDRSGESIPYLMLQLRDPNTGLLPLAGVRVGPSASFQNERAYLVEQFTKHGYMDVPGNQPRIWQSKLVLPLDAERGGPRTEERDSTS